MDRLKNTASPLIIAGAGIGGLAAALALAKRGYPTRVLEQAPEIREVGAGIQLGPNSWRWLRELDRLAGNQHVSLPSFVVSLI